MLNGKVRWPVLLFLVLAAVCSCNQGDEGDGYPSYTEDLGKECEFTCYDDWCFKTNYPWCSAQICIGQVEDLYCGVFCFNQESCPEGYTCAMDCDLNAPDTYCVKDKDYVHLIELGICPLIES